MTTFERRYNDDQRQAVYELKTQGRSGEQVSRLCAQGVKGLDPFEITKDTANRIFREEREVVEALTHSPLAEKTDLQEVAEELTKRQITLLERAQKQAQRDISKGVNDVGKLDRLTNAVMKLRKELMVPATAARANTADTTAEEPKGFLESLAAES